MRTTTFVTTIALATMLFGFVVPAGAVGDPSGSMALAAPKGSASQPGAVPANQVASGPTTGTTSSTKSSDIPPPPERERWTVFEHHQVQPDGHVRAEFHTAPVFSTRDQIGAPAESAEIVEEDGGFTVDGLVADVSFSDSDEPLLTMGLEDGFLITLRSDGLDLSTLTSTEPGLISYSDVAPETDLRFRTGPGGLVKELVLHGPNAPTEFTFELLDPGRVLGELEAQSDGSYLASRVTSEGIRVRVPHPFAYEAAGGVRPTALGRDSADVEVEQIPGGYKLTLSVAPDWLEGRDFPIVLDPTLTFEDDSGLLIDGYSFVDAAGCGGCLTVNNTHEWLFAGAQDDADKDYHRIRSYLRFDLSSIPPASVIHDATFKGYLDACIKSESNCDGQDYEIAIHEITGSWDASSTWDEINAVTSTTSTTSRLWSGSTFDEWHDFDVTSLAANWTADGASNHGLAMRLVDETKNWGPAYRSSRHPAGNGPQLVVNYTPPVPAPTVVSSSHPDDNTWYPTGDVELQWDVEGSSDLDGYQWALDNNPATIPDDGEPTTRPSLELENIADGEWWFHIRAHNSAGEWGDTAHYRIRIDTTAPPTPNISSASHPDPTVWSTDSSADLSWSATDAITDVKYVTKLDQSPISEPSGTPSTTDSRTYHKSAGEWWLHVAAIDAAGNRGPTSHYTFRIDDQNPTKPPIVSSSHIPDEGSVDPTVEVWWDPPVEDHSGLDAYIWTFSEDSSVTLKLDDPLAGQNESGPYATTAKSDVLTVGEWYFHIRGVDNNGNHSKLQTYGPFLIGVGDDAAAPPPPTVTSTTQPDENLWSRVSRISVEWETLTSGPAASTQSTTTAEQDEDVEEYSYVLDNDPTTTPDTIADHSGSTGSVTYRDVADGDWWFHIRGKSGIAWSRPTHYRIRIDSTGPPTPTITSPTHPAGQWSSQPHFAATWTADSIHAPIDSFKIALDQQPDTSPTNTGDRHGTTQELDDGIWYLHVEATDAAGNTGTITHQPLYANADGSFGIQSPVDGQMVWETIDLRASALADTIELAYQANIDSNWIEIARASDPGTGNDWPTAWDTLAGTPPADGDLALRAVFVLPEGETPPLDGPTVTLGNDATGVERVEADHEAGLLSEDDRALFGIYALTDPDQAPEKYQTINEADIDGTPAAMSLLAKWNELAQETKDAITDHFAVTIDTDTTASSDDATLASNTEGPTDGGGVGGGQVLAAPDPTQGPVLAFHGSPTNCANEGHHFVGTLLLPCLYESTHFRVLYDTTPGRLGSLTGEGADDQITYTGSDLIDGGNGVADFVDRALWSLEEARRVYEQLGYQLPSEQTTVAVWWQPSPGGGFVPPVPFADETIWLDSRGSGMYIPIHEYFHVSQFRYVSISDIGTGLDLVSELIEGDYRWWMESTAEWATQQVFLDLERNDRQPDARSEEDIFDGDRGRYANDLPSVLHSPEDALNETGLVDPIRGRGRAYGSFIFANHLEDEFGTDVIRQIWDITGDGFFSNSVFHSITKTIENHDSTFDQVIASYWNKNLQYPLDYQDLPPLLEFRDPEEIWRPVMNEAGDDEPAHDHEGPRQSTRRGTTPGIRAGGAHLLEIQPLAPTPGLVRLTLQVDRGALGSFDPERLTVMLTPSDGWLGSCGEPSQPAQRVRDEITLEVEIPEGCDRVWVTMANHVRPDGGGKRFTVNWTIDYFQHHAVLSHGDVRLGVNYTASLGVPTTDLSAHVDAGFLGVRYDPTGVDGLAEPQGPCEGWGYYDWDFNQHAGVSRCYFLDPRDIPGLELVDFNVSGNTATSTLDLASVDRKRWVRLVHQYAPSSETGIFQVNVTIENRGDDPITDYRYRRVIDWDVEKPSYDGREYITARETIIGSSPIDVNMDTRGLGHPDPSRTIPFDPEHTYGWFENAAPAFGSDADYGSHTLMHLGMYRSDLAPDAAVTFPLFIGATPDQTTAETALTNLESNAYVLAQPHTFAGANLGTPNTFIFGVVSLEPDGISANAQ